MGVLRPKRRAVKSADTSRLPDNSLHAEPPSWDSSLELYGMTKMQSFKGLPGEAFYVGWSPDGTMLAATSAHGGVAVWPETGGQSPRLLRGHGDENILGLVWHPTRPVLATAGIDHTVRLWDIDTGTSQILALDQSAYDVDWSPDGRWLAVADGAGDLGVWDPETGALLAADRVHQQEAYSVCWSLDGQLLITGSLDKTVSIQNSENLRIIRRLTMNDDIVSVALSPDGNSIAAASGNHTTCVWDTHTGRERVVLEGHTGALACVQFSPDGEFLASGANDGTARLWRRHDWECVAVVPNVIGAGVGGLAFHPYRPLIAIKRKDAGEVDCWQLDYDKLLGVSARPKSRRYVNAKVVLLGDTGVGKSGLGLVLSGQAYQPTDSTHGRNVWTFDAQEVETPGGSSQTREVLLWDLAGQPGYRLIHQLHLNEVAVALIVFDSRSETDPFSGVRHWVRALAQAREIEGNVHVPLRAYLVAARADRGGVAVTQERVQRMLGDLGLDGFFETSAKEGWQVSDLAQAIRTGIDWDALPMVSSSELFDSIKQFLLEEKEQGRLLSTADDLFRAYQRAQPAVVGDADLRASFETCIGRVESRGLIRRLHFGGLVLLQPELLDAYASAMVQAAKEEPDGLGFISEEAALRADFRLAQSERVKDGAQEKLLLIATVEELLRHEIALKEMTDRGADLVFPSQFTRERPDAPDIPGKQAAFTFEGPLNNIYATLAVRLSHSVLFKREAMWQNVASYTATGGGHCGIHLRELDEGSGELALFYDGSATAAVRSQFEAYVADHLQLRAIAGTVTRRTIRACADCGYVLPEDLVQRRLGRGAATIRCPACDEAVISLLDEEPAAPTATKIAVAEMNRSADARRDRNVAATQLKGKIEANDYDVFLCHNSSDKEQVKAIAKRLMERGVLPWLDEWDVRPGTRWQDELARQLKSIKSAAVFIGPKGSGPWQDLEIQKLLQQFAKHKRPIIPVILEGRKGRPQLPGFLGLWHVVDMRQAEPDPFAQLVWGITGERQPTG